MLRLTLAITFFVAANAGLVAEAQGRRVEARRDLYLRQLEPDDAVAREVRLTHHLDGGRFFAANALAAMAAATLYAPAIVRRARRVL